MKKSQQKREPTLADRLLASPQKLKHLFGQDWYEQRLQGLRAAKRFVLDAQASQYLGEMIRDNPEVIADAQEFALRPFENMWVEINVQAFYGALHDRRAESNADTFGYLFEGPVVYSASGHREAVEGSDAGFGVMEFILHRPLKEYEEQELCEFAGVTTDKLDEVTWGPTWAKWEAKRWVGMTNLNRDDMQLYKERISSLRLNHTMRVARTDKDIPGIIRSNLQGPYADNTRQEFNTALMSASGDLRNIVAVLLYLNRTRELQVTRDVGFGSVMRDRKPKPMLPHSVIGMRLDPREVFLNLVQSESPEKRSVRLHDVKGHFCHDKASKRGCTHGIKQEGDFGELWIEYQPLKWRCERCGGLRWWRREHSRGTLHKGVVTQSYAVTR